MTTQNRKQLRFWLNLNDIEEKKLHEFIESLGGNYSAYIKSLIKSDINGDIEKNPDSMEVLKREKMKADIEWKKTQTAYTKKKMSYMNIFGAEPSLSGARAISKNVKTQFGDNFVSVIDEKNHRFQCPECGILFVHAEDRHDIVESKQQLLNHYFENHNEEIPARTIEELSQYV